MTNYSCFLVIGYKSASKLLAMLVLPHLNVVTANDNIATLGGILLIFLYLLWLGSEYVIDTYSLYYGVYKLG